jgi:hypothetical protein
VVADAPLEAPVNPLRSPIARRGATLLVLAVVGLAALGLFLVPSDPPARADLVAATTPVTGNISGPTILATGGTGEYHLNGTGGPAYAANGTLVGNVSYYASVAAGNTSGVTVSPDTANFTANASRAMSLGVNSIAQTVTITVEISSVYQKLNASINLTYVVTVVVPYVVSAKIVNGASSTVLSFPVTIDLDSAPVGTVTVPTLTPGDAYNLSYSYPTTGLSPGEHTFTISLANEHGLVEFANGQTTYTASFYVEEPATNNTIWYVAGAVAFFGVLFIFATRVAARRRGALRK